MRINNLVIIYNPVAGWRRRRRLDNFIREVQKLGGDVSIRETTARGDAEQFAREAASTGVDCIVAAGGDGTINEIANGLIDAGLPSQVPLAVLPLGTANVFALELGLSSSMRRSAQTILNGVRQEVHLGTLNNRYFIQMAGVGFDAQVVADVTPNLKRRLGKLAYVWKTLRGFIRYRLPTFAVAIDGEFYSAASVVIANGHYYGGKFTCASQADLTDDALHVCLFKSNGGWNALRYAVGLVRGRLHKYHDVDIVRGHRLEIGGGDAEPVQADGDIVSVLPASIRGGRAAIPVIVPA